MSNDKDKSKDQATSPYQSIKTSQDGEHPADDLVAKRVPQTECRERMRELSADLLDALGDKKDLWIELETLQQEFRLTREEAFFDVGYGYGVTAGRAEAFHAFLATASEEARELATRIRTMCKSAGLPAPVVLASLLETAWIFTLDLDNTEAT